MALKAFRSLFPFARVILEMEKYSRATASSFALKFQAKELGGGREPLHCLNETDFLLSFPFIVFIAFLQSFLVPFNFRLGYVEFKR